jgi:hypothetical protein
MTTRIARIAPGAAQLSAREPNGTLLFWKAVLKRKTQFA